MKFLNLLFIFSFMTTCQIKPNLDGSAALALVASIVSGYVSYKTTSTLLSNYYKKQREEEEKQQAITEQRIVLEYARKAVFTD